MLAPLAPFYPDLAEGVLAHHERWDGTGYPKGLSGDRIPLSARIVMLADTFDAVTHSALSSGRGADTAAEVIACWRGTQFDPELVDLMLLPPVSNDRRARTRLSPARGRAGTNDAAASVSRIRPIHVPMAERSARAALLRIWRPKDPGDQRYTAGARANRLTRGRRRDAADRYRRHGGRSSQTFEFTNPEHGIGPAIVRLEIRADGDVIGACRVLQVSVVRR